MKWGTSASAAWPLRQLTCWLIRRVVHDLGVPCVPNTALGTGERVTVHLADPGLASLEVEVGLNCTSYPGSKPATNQQ